MEISCGKFILGIGHLEAVRSRTHGKDLPGTALSQLLQ